MPSRALIHKLAEPLRFVLVGIIATAIQYAVYLLLLRSISATAALTVGYVVSMACNFLMTTYFTFRTKPTKKKAGGFVLSHVVNWLLQLGVLNLLLLLSVPKVWAPLPMYMVCVPVNFLLVRHFVKADK